MARNDIFVNINAISPADAFVTGQQDMTAADAPELILGDTPTFNFYFTDNTNTWPSWAGNAAYTVTWALSDAVSGDFAPAATTGNATPITGGWSIDLPLNAYDLVGLLNSKRISQAYPVTYLWQQIRVTAPTGKEVTRAMVYTPIRYRAISDTQNTESATPTGGRFVTVNNTNDLTTPTLAQFYDANPVPASALPLGLGTDTAPANGELLIGNGTGYVTSTLTAGTGVTITNGAGSITIDASGAQELLTATVKNAESVPITKGQVVYLYSATGNLPSVKLASNSSDATSAKTFGVVSDTSIAANGTGTVTCVGVVDGLNLGGFSDGDTVYLGATAGTITATKPYAPNHLVYVGIIERANAGNGELYVKVQNGYELDEIHDVQITSAPAAGALLMRDATNSLWKANRLSAGTNIAVTNADTSVTIGLTGTVAVANGGTGVTTSTGSGSVVLSTSPSLTTPILGTPQSGTLTNCTGLPVSTGVSGLGSGVATFLATPTSANLRTVVTDETGTGALVFANTPSLVTPDIGAATGTSATLTGNANVSDVRLGGTSGPSAKSSIAARAARQGLVFDGTAGAPCTLGSAIGTSDATIAAFIDVPSSNPSAIRTITYIATGAAWKPNDCVFYIETNGTLNFQLRGTLVGDTRIATVTENLVSSYGGKRVLVTATRVGTTLTIFINGVSAAFTVAGSAITWANSIDGTTLRVGDLSGNSLPFVGFIAPYIENRALSAAEVVSLYEAGVPSGSDYNSASNTAINTSNFVNGGTAYGTFDGVSATGFHAIKTAGTQAFAGSRPVFSVATGRRFLATFTATLTSGVAPTVFLANSTSGASRSGASSVAAGSNSVVLTATSTDSSAALTFYNNPAEAAEFTISSVSLTPLGLLLAPDAAQAGGGLTWYDTSGNAANITLPASGVTWNVPTSGKMASSLTIGGTGVGLTLAPSSGAASMTLNGPASGSAVNFALTGTNKYTAEYVNGSDFFAIGRSGVAYDLVLKGGNALVGTTTDNSATFAVNRSGTGPASSGSTSTAAIRAVDVSNDLALDIGINSAASPYPGWIQVHGRTNQATNYPLALNPNGGNVLLGTTTDGGQKLQVAGTVGVQTTTSGTGRIYLGLGSGTGWGVNAIEVNDTGGGLFAAYYNGTSKGYMLALSNGLKFNAVTGGSNITLNDAGTIVLASNNTTALTLDSSQNATFAGTVRTTALGIGTAPNSYYTIYGTNTLTGNSNQAFLNAAPTFDSGATGQGNVLWLQGKTAAASYTVAALSGIKIESPSLGAGSSVTTVYGLRIQAQTGGTTNYAIYTDGGNVRFGSLPTSSAGLPSGAIWNNSGVLNIVP